MTLQECIGDRMRLGWSRHAGGLAGRAAGLADDAAAPGVCAPRRGERRPPTWIVSEKKLLPADGLAMTFPQVAQKHMCTLCMQSA